MDIHYNAFISYRHHPQDIKVAEAIHRGLEHFRVPKALKKKKDTKLRLFRDKEELPITSNLSDDITRALRNSDFLIVICSTHTKESMWVQREIETFLQTHDYSRVLTVLVDGEPYDTIPAVLCSQEQIDSITGEKIMVPLEPLSCDWRVSRKKAYREELPRLAAALLGCGYDELRQRQRQYRIRRMVTAASIAASLLLAFSGYVFYNSLQLQKANDRLSDANAQIRNNYMTALTNQSQYLASAAMQNLDEGDRMLAMALAVEALPEYLGERPYITQAEYALSKALHAYTAEGQIAGVGRISCDALINAFDATDARDRMFVVDQLDMLSVWDLNNYSKLNAVPITGITGELLITPDDTVIFTDADRTLHCYDKDLNLLWTRENCYEIAFTKDRRSILAETADNYLLFLNASDGAELYPAAQILLPELGQFGWSVSFCQDDYDLSKPILLQYSQYGEELHLLAWDLQQETLQKIASFPKEYSIRRTTYNTQGNVVVLAISDSTGMNGSFAQMMTYSPVGIRVLSFSLTGEQLWEAKLTSYSYSSNHVLRTIDNRETLFCQVDNLLAVIDENTGKVLSTCETGAIPLWVKMEATSATLLLEDGSMGVYNYDDNQFNCTRYFKENINRAFAGKGVFLNQSLSRDILVYASISDENWQSFEGTYGTSVAQRLDCDGLAAIYNYDAVCVFDVQEQKLLWTMEEPSSASFQLLSLTQDTLWFSDIRGKTLYKADLASGESETFLLPETTEENVSLYYRYTEVPLMTQDAIYVKASNLLTSELYLVKFDLSSQESSLVDLHLTDATIPEDCELLTICGETGYFWSQKEGTVYAGNIRTGLSELFLEDLTARPIIQVLSDGNCMVSIGNQVRFLQKDGTITFQTELTDATAVSGFRTKDKVYLLTDAGLVSVYSLGGRKLADVEVELYSTFYSTITQKFDPKGITWNITKDGDLLVNIFRAGNLIHHETDQLRAWIPNCVSYQAQGDEIVTVGKDPQTGASKLGVYPCYSTNDVIHMAQEALGSYRLTPEQMEQYGIS